MPLPILLNPENPQKVNTRPRGGLGLLFDLLPLLVFFISYRLFGIFPATAISMILSGGLIGFSLISKRPPGALAWITLGAISLMGSLTLIFQNPLFIKWKPTLVFWAFALLLGWWGQGSGSFPKKVFSKWFRHSRKFWRRLNLLWVAFFVLMGGANLWALVKLPETTWVAFKVFGLTGLLAAFLTGQVLVLQRVAARVPGKPVFLKTTQAPRQK